jgi:hypothetical protein
MWAWVLIATANSYLTKSGCLPACHSMLNWNTCARTDSNVESSEWRGSLNTLRAEWPTQLPVVKCHCRLTSHHPLDNMTAWSVGGIWRNGSTDQQTATNRHWSAGGIWRNGSTGQQTAANRHCCLVTTVTVTVFWGATPQAVMDTDISQKRTASLLTVEATRLYTGTTCTASAEVIPTFTCKKPASLTNRTKSRLVSYKACCGVTGSVLQGGFIRNQSGLERHPVCSSVGAPCRNQRIFCARKAVLLLLVWAARKDQFAALSDRIMNLNVSCRKRFLLASERRIVGRVHADRIIGFVFRAVLGIMPRWWVGGYGVDGVEQGCSMICDVFHLDIRMSAAGGETRWNEKFEHENVRKNCRKVTLSEDKPVFGRQTYTVSRKRPVISTSCPCDSFVVPELKKN